MTTAHPETIPTHRRVAKYDGSTPDSFYTYLCGHCGAKAAGLVIAEYKSLNPFFTDTKWLSCPSCGKGSVLNNAVQSPGAKFGTNLQGLPPEVASAYEEARRCVQCEAYTASELICRKILMHAAVDKGANEGESFVEYLDFLQREGYTTPPMRPWIDLIRRHGNMATHRLEETSPERAKATVTLTSELLRLVYEMGHLANVFAPQG